MRRQKFCAIASAALAASLVLAANAQDATVAERVVVEEEVVEIRPIPRSWDIDVPIRLKAADPQELCTVQFHTIFDWRTSSRGADDDVHFVSRIQWGFIENHELFLQTPLRIGDGKVPGNVDATVGWHWRLWEEQDILPAFALRNSLRLPSGYRGRGLDWEAMGVLTKSIVPDEFRIHLNPFLRLQCNDGREIWQRPRDGRIFRQQDGLFGSRDGRARGRDFQWGFYAGFDWRITDQLILAADYVHESAWIRGWRNQHMGELGLQYEISPSHSVAAAARTTLDGDSLGDNFGASLSYMFTFDYGPRR